MDTIDFTPATTAVAELVRGVSDDQLKDPTPCPAWTVADLLDHLGGLSRAFRGAARKEPPGGSGVTVDGSRLEDGWRERIADGLAELAEAWRDPAAYDGMTAAGGIELPAGVAALVALDEVVVHGWDLARATGQRYDPGEPAVLASLGFAEGWQAPPDAPDGGPFGPAIPVSADAPALDRLAAATGRDPHWHAA